MNFEDRWWPLQTIWIQMKPHKIRGFIWDPNCLTFRLYISKKMGGNNEFFENLEKNKYLKKLPSMQRVNIFYCSCGCDSQLDPVPICAGHISVDVWRVRGPSVAVPLPAASKLQVPNHDPLSVPRTTPQGTGLNLTLWMLGNFLKIDLSVVCFSKSLKSA